MGWHENCQPFLELDQGVVWPQHGEIHTEGWACALLLLMETSSFALTLWTVSGRWERETSNVMMFREQPNIFLFCLNSYLIVHFFFKNLRHSTPQHWEPFSACINLFDSVYLFLCFSLTISIKRMFWFQVVHIQTHTYSTHTETHK